MTGFEMIRDFHTKFELIYGGSPRKLPEDYINFRIKFMQEELDEYVVACEEDNLEKQFDALIDLVYVALGTAYLQGFKFDEGFRRVHEANMKKVRVLNEEESTKSTGRGSVYDVKKPHGWTAPDLSDLVK